jgi:hypothetical protein
MPGTGANILILLWRSLRISNTYSAISLVISVQVARQSFVPMSHLLSDRYLRLERIRREYFLKGKAISAIPLLIAARFPISVFPNWSILSYRIVWPSTRRIRHWFMLVYCSWSASPFHPANDSRRPLPALWPCSSMNAKAAANPQPP